jgi:hypothetical protein
MKQRTETIHSKVSAADVLQSNGVRLRYGGSRPEQISCPFHGVDTNPSARYHPEEGDGHSGVWCFVCNARWDAILLWKKFNGFEGSFGSLLRALENAYGIEVPDPPEHSFGDFDSTSNEDMELSMLFDACEGRLRKARKAFQMMGFLTLATILERLYFRLEKGLISPLQTKQVLRQILDKIAEKERLCPEG